jgi:hypothetical protein
MDPLQVIIWICVAVFAITALIAILNLIGVYKLPNQKQGETLFKILIVEIVVIAVAAFGNVITGRSKIDPGKSIAQQVLSKEKTIATSDAGITFKPGIISDNKAVQSIKKLAPETPTTYSGKNFINKDAGFLLTVEYPALWQLAYNPLGMTNSTFAINTFTHADGSYLTVGIEAVPAGTTIEQYVTSKNRYYYLQPQVSYDLPSSTAFLIFTNPVTMGESYMKVIINQRTSKAYVATANYNKNLSVPQTMAMLASMVASFTVIAE